MLNIKVSYTVILPNPKYKHEDVNRKPTMEIGGIGTCVAILNREGAYQHYEATAVVIDDFNGKFYEVPLSKLKRIEGV